MGSFENKIKSFERHYGIHLRSLRRSRKFTTLLTFIFILFVYLVYNLSSGSKKSNLDNDTEHSMCIKKHFNKYASDIEAMNLIVSKGGTDNEQDSFVSYTGNGFIGISLNSKQGIYAYYQKSLSLQLKYNPSPYVYIENYNKEEAFYVDFQNGLAHNINTFQTNTQCIKMVKTILAHRIRPSLMIEELYFSNPTKEPLSFDVIQNSPEGWNNTQTKIEKFQNHEFTITTGIINVIVDTKEKHLCVAIVSSKLPDNIKLKPYDLNVRHHILTVVKFTKVLLTAKMDSLQGTLKDLETKAKLEFEHSIDIGLEKLKKEHMDAWNDIWKTGFSISRSLAENALNGNQINSTIYYVLCNNQAPLHEISFEKSTELESLNQLAVQNDRCYEGFSTLQAVKLWKSAKNEDEVSDLSSLWYLTLMKNGCMNFLKLGVDGIIQAIVLSIGGFRFSNHHLELNLNPKQIHRNYGFRNLNYANITYFNITVEVGEDNHAKIYVTMDKIESSQYFYACDAGCIDEPVELVSQIKHEFPVKLTDPPTAILYITADKIHASELKHILHVQEVQIAPPQDVNSVALHRHGHQLGGLSIIFWTIFVFLIVVFHLFLCKLIFREILRNSSSDYEIPMSNSNRYRTRAV